MNENDKSRQDTFQEKMKRDMAEEIGRGWRDARSPTTKKRYGRLRNKLSPELQEIADRVAAEGGPQSEPAKKSRKRGSGSPAGVI
jgi:hypothetical protein